MPRSPPGRHLALWRGDGTGDRRRPAVRLDRPGADGLQMRTRAGALLLAALAYGYARRHATDARFTFGTGKLGDLAGFTGAVGPAMIALLIGWEAVSRFLRPVPIAFAEAIPIACVGLAVNIISAWPLGAGHHHHHHGHDDCHVLDVGGTRLTLDIDEDGVPQRFRVREPVFADALWVETARPDGASQHFRFVRKGGVLESVKVIPEPHAFTVNVHPGDAKVSAVFEEYPPIPHTARPRITTTTCALQSCM
jgi:hypothetical protein